MKPVSIPPPRRLAIWGAVLALVCVGAPRIAKENFFSEGGRIEEERYLPEFPEPGGGWIGTEPLTLEDLRGRVTLLEVWTFGCINCVRSIPFTNGIAERYGPDVLVLGIHSPEFDWERDLVHLEATMAEHGVHVPSYIDESLDYFFALGATGWPAFYVVDRDLRIRGLWVGEIHEGTLRARELESLLDELLAE